jgi:hypothetical protein
MKATWNIINSETIKLKGRTFSKYKNFPDAVNDNFFSTAEKIMQSIRYSDTEGTSDNNNPTYYFSQISHYPFSNTKFNNTSNKDIERIINSISVKN